MVLSASALIGCSALPHPPPEALRYDLGPLPAGSGMENMGNPPLALDVVQAWPGTDIRYRLAWADARQIHSYQRARWAQPPAQLLAQLLAQMLALHHPPPRPGADGPRLRVELMAFDQVFDAPGRSHAVLRLRATLHRGEAAQTRWFDLGHPARTPDAAGAVQALAEAGREAARQINAWLTTLEGGQ